ncbi:galactose-6-sulfurylase [Malassezia brasiliensis]|uniref:Protein farnesyltransferase/geranylgeranyltransferase type-1 subunit alpha n=1 Tax=Malassezia brasiliensis TaxID=1821822 RepID=A0AAF0IQK8_9BASI|nr:galactose-6-sulfurylase [Malassezia brasiliensis]
MDLFRALKQMYPGHVEASDRALQLTAHLVCLNPANYSIWQYRAEVLLQLSEADGNHDRLRRELDFLDEFAKHNMKNYQIWQHRRIIVSVLGDPSRELDFTRANLSLDAKNYHTWAYRQWVLAHFGGLHEHEEKLRAPGAGAFPQLWDGELAFVDEMLKEDIRNNSAYNHRWFCIFGRSAEGRRINLSLQATRDAEIAYALEKIAMAPNNASPWNYLRGLCTALEPRKPMGDIVSEVATFVSDRDHVRSAEHPETDEAGRTPPHALEWLLDSAIEQYQATQDESLRKEVHAILARLRHADPARTKYWNFRALTLP